MKIEIEKSEYDRLKSREEKLMAYYEWFVDKENDLATVEDIVNKNIKLEEENKKLREELEWYKKQYEHSMWEDEWKLVKWGYASFNEYWELMEEDTLQELKDIWEI